MARFLDKVGQEWSIELDVNALDRLVTDAAFDLDAFIARPDTLSGVMFQSPRKLGQVLWVLCEEQAKGLGIDPKSFGGRLNRETLDRATDALVEAILLFYPRSSAGRAIKGRLPEMLRKMDTDIEAKVNEQIERTLSGIATDSRESAVLIPDG